MSTFSVRKPSDTSAVISFPTEVIGGQDAMELAHLVRQCASEGKSTVILDLAEVLIMNSSGLGMLVSSLTSLKRQGAKLRLAAVPEKVESLLTMTQLKQIFDIYPTVSDAVEIK
ncbi:MAG: STAS domain-containing protein [Ignavibacteria bacterium]|nr:STAS domain-containing protein [Ignavibacteria bacterium]